LGSVRLTSSGLRAVHVIAGLDEAHGGTSYSVPRLCRALAEAGVNTKLMSVAPGSAQPSSGGKDGYYDLRFSQDGARIPLLRGLRLSRGLSAALKDAAPDASVIHNHGLWLAPNLAAGTVAKGALRPLVIAPRGMLSPGALRFSQWKKKLLWHLGQERIIREASCLHATSELEYNELRALGLGNPIAIIPNGVDIPQIGQKRETDQRTVLFVGRIHPKKGLDRLLRAWAKVEQEFPSWRLRIIGPTEADHHRALERIIVELKIGRASLEGPVYGGAKLAAYQEADLFVLPSISENFGLTAAEALAAGVPVIATKGTPWSGLLQNRCGWWVDLGVESLAAALATGMSAPPEVLQEMGMRGRSWMAQEFSWARVGAEMAMLYSWLAGKGDSPASIRLQ